MNYKKYINQKIINKNNEIGLVVSFDDEHITIKYLDKKITYNSEVSFKNKYLSFIDSNLQYLIEQNLLSKEDQTLQREKMFEDNNKAVIKRNKAILEQYKKVSLKNKELCSLFGRDFIYPPFIKFKKKYRYLIREKRAEGMIAQTYGQ